MGLLAIGDARGLAMMVHDAWQVTLGGLAISLSFQQQSIFGSINTGGALWHSELVLAEYCAREDFSPCSRVLELGCGVAPCAGLTRVLRLTRTLSPAFTLL